MVKISDLRVALFSERLRFGLLGDILENGVVVFTVLKEDSVQFAWINLLARSVLPASNPRKNDIQSSDPILSSFVICQQLLSKLKRARMILLAVPHCPLSGTVRRWKSTEQRLDERAKETASITGRFSEVQNFEG